MDPSESEDSDSESLTPSLEAAMPPEQRLSTQERLRLARRRRADQLKRWSQREREWKAHGSNSNNLNHKKNREFRRNVTFIANVMLLEAAARNDLAEVRRLLESGVSPDSTNEDGLTALHQCCIDDSEEMMKLLIQYGGNPNATDTEKWTPLHAAATCGHLHLVKFLIDAGAELLSVNADGNMPYDLCEDDTTLSYIENEMARRGVTQELIDDTRSQTERQMLSDLVAWQATGGDMETRDHSGATPLHIASANGYLSVVEFLLDHHASTEVVDDDLWQPLHAAACWGHLEVVESLAQNGGNINARTRNGETPFDICEDPDIKERLLELKEISCTRGQPRGVRRTRSASTRTRSIRRTSLREKMNTTKRDVKNENLYFMQSVDGQKQPQSQNGHNSNHHGDHAAEVVDIKDVELTLLPSYLNESNNPQDNTDLLESISKPNSVQSSSSPPKRPPRSNQSPEGPSERINVKVTVNNPPSQQQQQQPPATSVDISNISPSSSGGPQTLADLKKQRSMNRVAQQNSPQAPIRENSSNSSDQHHQHTNTVPPQQPNRSSSPMKNHYHPPEDKTTASVSNTAAPASSRPEHNKQDRGSSSMRHKSNGEERPHHHNSNSSGGNSSSKQRNSKNGSSGRSGGGHRGQSHRNSSSAAAANVKKFTHNEVVGPPPKKTGCCRVM